MFESLVNAFLISFREGIEAALVVMTVLVIVGKRNDPRLKTVTLWAVAAAVVICSAVAYFLGTIALVNNVELEVALYGAAAVAVLTMVIWMMRHGKKMKQEIEEKVNRYASRKSTLLAVIGLFLFVFFMVAREGFELALFLLAFGAGIGGAYYVLAMIAGLGAAIAIGYLLSKGIVRVNVGKFLQLTAYLLLILVVQLVLDFFHEGMEAGMLPEPHQNVINVIDYLSHDMPIFSYLSMIGFIGVIVYFLRQASTKKKQFKSQPAITTQS